MEKKTDNKKKGSDMEEIKTNPLVNKKVYLRFVPKDNSFAGSNKHHVLWGNKAIGATTTLCVPILESTGVYKNILTNNEKDFLEGMLGLERNALSVYNKVNNFWDNYKITINCKEGLHLDLSNPEDYIKYKVLLANSDIVAPSVQERTDRPKATYQFEIVDEGEEVNLESVKVDASMSSYMEFGKIQDDVDTMRVLVELIDARPYAQNTKKDFLRVRIKNLIDSDPKGFLKAITDPMLHTKVIIRRAQELGKISKKGDYFYLASDGSPLCEGGENPTLSVAARFLNLPAHQDIKFLLESEVNKNSSK